MADNYLKLITVYKKMGMYKDTLDAEQYGKEYVSRSLASVKTEWAFQIQKGFEETVPKK
jgi:hypothetical protein